MPRCYSRLVFLELELVEAESERCGNRDQEFELRSITTRTGHFIGVGEEEWRH